MSGAHARGEVLMDGKWIAYVGEPSHVCTAHETEQDAIAEWVCDEEPEVGAVFYTGRLKLQSLPANLISLQLLLEALDERQEPPDGCSLFDHVPTDVDAIGAIEAEEAEEAVTVLTGAKS